MKNLLEWGQRKRLKITKDGVEKGNLSLNAVGLLGVLFFKFLAFAGLLGYGLGYRFNVGENTKDMYEYVKDRKRNEYDAD